MGGPPGCIGECNRSGWINEHLFLVYIRHLIYHIRCSKEHKILLILDNHEVHNSVAANEEAKENGIVMLTIPPHTSHRLQPLDKAVYDPFKLSYNRAMEGWLRSNPGKTITIYDISSIVTQAKSLQWQQGTFVQDLGRLAFIHLHRCRLCSCDAYRS